MWFTNNGVDYFGNFPIKLFKRKVQSWTCLRTCLSFRSLNRWIQNFFFEAVHRFITGRKKLKSVISDKGSIFVGIASELKAAFKELNHFEKRSNLAQNGIQWTISSPCSSTYCWCKGVISDIEPKSGFQFFGQRIFEREKTSNQKFA